MGNLTGYRRRITDKISRLQAQEQRSLCRPCIQAARAAGSPVTMLSLYVMRGCHCAECGTVADLAMTVAEETQ